MIYWQTVDDVLRTSLQVLMEAEEFSAFRLVGGTALSLQLGHRISVDIDLFTDAEYSTIDFDILEKFLINNFEYVDRGFGGIVGMGKSYLIGKDKDHSVKLDLYYTEPFIDAPLVVEGLRMATLEEIIAMKVDVVQRTGRKKDFWDLYELLPRYSIDTMLTLHEKRYEYSHDEALIITNFTNFTEADQDFEPICLRGYHWELIKEDIILALSSI